MSINLSAKETFININIKNEDIILKILNFIPFKRNIFRIFIYYLNNSIKINIKKLFLKFLFFLINYIKFILIKDR